MYKSIKKLLPGQLMTVNIKSLKTEINFSITKKKVANQLDVSLEIMDAKIDWILHFDKMIWHLDEPQADLAPINVLKISDHARKTGIKVLISGTGGDDLFSGYRRHLAQKINNKLNNIFPVMYQN